MLEPGPKRSERILLPPATFCITTFLCFPQKLRKKCGTFSVEWYFLSAVNSNFTYQYIAWCSFAWLRFYFRYTNSTIATNRTILDWLVHWKRKVNRKTKVMLWCDFGKDTLTNKDLLHKDITVGIGTPLFCWCRE